MPGRGTRQKLRLPGIPATSAAPIREPGAGTRVRVVVHNIVRVVGIAVAGTLLGLQVIATLVEPVARWFTPAHRRLSDFQVYWAATGALVHGRDLYSAHSLNGQQFTYPPAAALVLAPMRALPLQVVEAGWMLTTLATAIALPILVVRKLAPPGERVSPTLFGIVAMLASDGVRSSVHYGQVGVYLVALVLLPVLYLPRFAGVGAGAAAAFHVNPALILVVAAVRRRWRFVIVGVVTAVSVTVAAAIAMPGASLAYWTRLLWRTQRVGDLWHPANRSLAGVLARAGVGEAWIVAALAAALLVSLVTVALWFRGPGRGRRHARPQLDLASSARLVVVGGLLSEVLSPVAWRHHWVWLPAAALLVFLEGRRVAGVALAVLAALPLPQLSFPGLTFPWSGSVAHQVLLAVTFGVALAAIALCLLGPRGEAAPSSRYSVTRPGGVPGTAR
ncbi:MAG TPA: glycosyltransferase 87 family protein [Actinomycetales bacterium]|nr:glycosyltransferase 87 family protein [Actinomycetales bacterium]